MKLPEKMVDTNARNIAWAGIGVFAASIIGLIAYQASKEETKSEDSDSDDKEEF